MIKIPFTGNILSMRSHQRRACGTATADVFHAISWREMEAGNWTWNKERADGHNIRKANSIFHGKALGSIIYSYYF